MEYYVLHVETGTELDFVRRAEQPGAQVPPGKLYLPQRELVQSRRGKKVRQRVPLYPGYIFWEVDHFEPYLVRGWRSLSGFYRVLGFAGRPRPLNADELDVLRHFMSFGEVLGLSTASFDEHDRITILQGPLKGLEGRIIKVDKRKKRAKVRLDMYDSPMDIDFGFEILRGRDKEPVV